MLPGDKTVNRIMQDTGMDRMQAINHARQREELQRDARPARPRGVDWGLL